MYLQDDVVNDVACSGEDFVHVNATKHDLIPQGYPLRRCLKYLGLCINTSKTCQSYQPLLSPLSMFRHSFWPSRYGIWRMRSSERVSIPPIMHARLIIPCNVSGRLLSPAETASDLEAPQSWHLERPFLTRSRLARARNNQTIHLREKGRYPYMGQTFPCLAYRISPRAFRINVNNAMHCMADPP